MLFELTFVYFMYNVNMVEYISLLMDLVMYGLMIFSPVIKLFIVCFYLTLLSVDTYINYNINSIDFISDEMEMEIEDEMTTVTLYPLCDYKKAYLTTMPNMLQSFGSVYLSYKNLVRPIELLYKKTKYLPPLYNVMNDHLVNTLYQFYVMVCSLWIVKYTVNKIKMFFIRKTISVVLSNSQIRTTMIDLVKNINNKTVNIDTKTINVNTTELNQKELKLE